MGPLHDTSLGPGAEPSISCGGSALDSALAKLLTEQYNPNNLEVKGRRVLVRCDLNVPLRKDGEGNPCIADDNRIRAALPTIKLLVGKGARVVLTSHLGRPKLEKRPADRDELSLAPVAKALAKELPSFVGMAGDCIGPEVEERVNSLEDGEVLLLENTRFHEGDTANDRSFAEQLARLADVFVNDAFGVVHRAQGSVTGVAELVPEKMPGLLVRKEVAALQQTLSAPERPFGVVIGGAKVADKLGVIDTLIEKADIVLIGGKMAFTFLAATGVQFHESQIEPALFEECRRMMKKAAATDVQLVLPVDVLIADTLDSTAKTYVSELNTTCCTAAKPCVEQKMFGADVGDETIELFTSALRKCKTIFWNGPVGKFEVEMFAKGTNAISKVLRDVSLNNKCTTVIGGGDSVNALRSLGYENDVTHVSTGGGASLELIEGKAMPGLEVLVCL